jgi:hypothetical protein
MTSDKLILGQAFAACGYFRHSPANKQLLPESVMPVSVAEYVHTSSLSA